MRPVVSTPIGNESRVKGRIVLPGKPPTFLFLVIAGVFLVPYSGSAQEEEEVSPATRTALGIGALRQGLEEGADEVRECASVGLAGLDLPEAFLLLEQSLSHADRKVRIAAENALIRRGDPSILPSVRRNLQARTWRIRREALRDYARIAGSKAVPTLTRFLLSQKQPISVRAAAADGLGIVRDSGSAANLLAQLESDQQVLRLHAILALGEIASPGAVAPLREYLQDLEDRYEQLLVLRALALTGDPEGLQGLERYLLSENRRHRTLARRTFLQRGTRYAHAVFRRALPVANPPAQFELILALVEGGDRQSVPALQLLLESGETHVREVAAAALVRFGNHDGYGILRKRMRESVWRYRDPVVLILAEGQDPVIGYIVQERFQKGEGPERFWAATVLIRFGFSPAARFLERIARQKDSPFRHRAAEALAREGDWSGLPALADRLGEGCGSGSTPELSLFRSAPPEKVLPMLDFFLRRGSPLARVNSATVLLAILGDTASLPDGPPDLD